LFFETINQTIISTTKTKNRPPGGGGVAHLFCFVGILIGAHAKFENPMITLSWRFSRKLRKKEAV
jgi:hypothetical protein